MKLSNVGQLHWIVEILPHSHTCRWVDLMFLAGWHAVARSRCYFFWVLRDAGRQRVVGTSQFGPLHRCTQNDMHWGTNGRYTFAWTKSLLSRTVDAVSSTSWSCDYTCLITRCRLLLRRLLIVLTVLYTRLTANHRSFRRTLTINYSYCI